MTVVFLANANSVHVERWLHILRKANISVSGYSVETPQEPKFGRWMKVGVGPGSSRYVTAGIMQRFVSTTGIVHAHNASGYGLAARISSKPYIVTTYGSEIYAVLKRGRAYRRLIGSVLRSAVAVTCTSQAMKDFVVSEFEIGPERVHMFSMGIPTDAFRFDADARDAVRKKLGFTGNVLIVSNRRIRPQYRIDTIVRAFSAAYQKDNTLRLALLEGDSLPHYAKRIHSLIEELQLQQGVVWVAGMQPQSVVHQYLLAGDIVVSIPETDQLSASIIEAVACGCRVLLSPLDAYQDLFSNGLAEPVNIGAETSLAAQMLAHVDATSPRRISAKALEWVNAHHGDEAVMRNVIELYRSVGAI